jgi:hypothetical protein
MYLSLRPMGSLPPLNWSLLLVISFWVAECEEQTVIPDRYVGMESPHEGNSEVCRVDEP